MKRVFYIAILLLIFIASFAYRKKPHKPVVKDAHHYQLPIPRILAEPMQKISPHLSSMKENNSGDASCEQQWSEIAEIDVNSYGSQNSKHSNEPGIFSVERVWDLLDRIGQVQVSHPCAKANTDNDLYERSRSILKWCKLAKALGPERAGEVGDERDMPSVLSTSGRLVRSSPMDKCLANFEMLRQDVADRATKNKDLSEITNVPLLMNKFFAAGRKNPSDLKTLSAIAERMIVIDPSNFAAASLAVHVSFAAWSLEKNSNPAATSAEFENAYERIDWSDDSYFAQYRLQYDLDRGDHALVREKAERMLSTDAGKNMANYYLAQVAHDEGDLESTRHYLNEILAGAFGDFKEEAYVALKRMAEEQPDSLEIPLFPAPGVSLINSFFFPAKLPGMESQEMIGGGEVGFTLVEDRFSQISSTRYRKYYDEFMGIPPRDTAGDENAE